MFRLFRKDDGGGNNSGESAAAAVKANMGVKNAYYFNKELGQWVVEGEEEEARKKKEADMMPPPSSMKEKQQKKIGSRNMLESLYPQTEYFNVVKREKTPAAAAVPLRGMMFTQQQQQQQSGESHRGSIVEVSHEVQHQQLDPRPSWGQEQQQQQQKQEGFQSLGGREEDQSRIFGMNKQEYPETSSLEEVRPSHLSHRNRSIEKKPTYHQSVIHEDTQSGEIHNRTASPSIDIAQAAWRPPRHTIMQETPDRREDIGMLPHPNDAHLLPHPTDAHLLPHPTDAHLLPHPTDAHLPAHPSMLATASNEQPDKAWKKTSNETPQMGLEYPRDVSLMSAWRGQQQRQNVDRLLRLHGSVQLPAHHDDNLTESEGTMNVPAMMMPGGASQPHQPRHVKGHQDFVGLTAAAPRPLDETPDGPNLETSEIIMRSKNLETVTSGTYLPHSKPDGRDNDMPFDYSTGVDRQSRASFHKASNDIHSKQQSTNTRSGLTSLKFPIGQSTEKSTAQREENIPRDIQPAMPGDIQPDWPIHRETPREIQRETPREIQRETPREIQRETPREIQREAPREIQRETPREIQGETSREIQREAPREVREAHLDVGTTKMTEVTKIASRKSYTEALSARVAKLKSLLADGLVRPNSTPYKMILRTLMSELTSISGDEESYRDVKVILDSLRNVEQTRKPKQITKMRDIKARIVELKQKISKSSQFDENRLINDLQTSVVLGLNQSKIEISQDALNRCCDEMVEKVVDVIKGMFESTKDNEVAVEWARKVQSEWMEAFEMCEAMSVNMIENRCKHWMKTQEDVFRWVSNEVDDLCATAKSWTDKQSQAVERSVMDVEREMKRRSKKELDAAQALMNAANRRMETADKMMETADKRMDTAKERMDKAEEQMRVNMAVESDLCEKEEKLRLESLEWRRNVDLERRQAQNEKRELEEKRRSVEETRKQLEETRKNLEETRKRMEEDFFERQQDLQREDERLQNEMEEMLTKKNELQRMETANNVGLAKLSAMEKELSKEATRMMAQVEEAHKETERLKEQRRQLEEETRQKNSSMDSREQQLIELQGRLNEWETRLRAKEDIMNETEREIEMKKKNLETEVKQWLVTTNRLSKLESRRV